MKTTTATPLRFPLPCLLSFGPRDERGRASLVPGRGEAGWTVYEFATSGERAAFMAANEASAMPCWKRIA